MSRMELLLPRDHITSFDLEISVNEAATLNQCTLETYTPPFQKASSGYRTTNSGHSRRHAPRQ